jgi:hypothetical protein
MSYNLLHLLSTNHKCTHACFIKTNAAQNKIFVRSFLKILENSRRMSLSQLTVKLKSAAMLSMFIYSFKIKTVGHVIKCTPFSLMHCFGYSLVTSTVCAELDPGAHMRCIRLPFLNRV